MPPAEEGIDESFRGLVLQLRGRIGLTQRELAERLSVHVHTVQAWEGGVSYPGAASLQGLIAAGPDAGGFATGHELAEAQTRWAEAVREAPPPGEWLAGAIGFLAPNEVTASGGEAAPLGQRLLHRHGWARVPGW